MTDYLVIALADATIGFVLFRSLCLRNRTVWPRAALVVAALVLAIPAALFSSNYLLHTPEGIWFYNLHSLPGAEATSGLVGALLGVMFAAVRLRPRWVGTAVLAISTVAAAMLMIAPFAKQLFFRQDYSKLENRWMDGLCVQTSGSTCVPAACATVIRMLGGSLTEREVAKEAGANRRGTEMWYVMRALRRHGYEVQVRTAKSLKDVPAPYIFGMKGSGGGHVAVVMSKTDTGPEIGDPLRSRQRYT